ncbi:DUF998 domain-containing protein [Micromonospora auratinigra]|uniref:DUF998 domain-containing protein n=1 Tax=Micromonospora auratinigra TaxID=261654 RepID=A0A1A8ZSX5_9ACTN|nr:DUF998 domain-containing protein [Micromonospora auratinigra]SBT46975.1 hypothetical protein GA0070611_3564 [Micromonospora auratinigra]
MDTGTRRPPQDALTVRQLRLGVGVVGIALPLVLIVGHMVAVGRLTLVDSLSGYYYTEVRDVFVGALCAIGVFLISYRYRRPDDLLGTVAGVLAVVVALCPTTMGAPAGSTGQGDRLVGVVHQVAAATLFVLLAVFCLFLFTRPDRVGVPPRPAAVRFYRSCGALILLAIGGALAGALLPADVRQELKPVLWCETVAVFAFAAAWLAKSDALLRAATPTDETGVERPAPAPARP